MEQHAAGKCVGGGKGEWGADLGPCSEGEEQRQGKGLR